MSDNTLNKKASRSSYYIDLSYPYNPPQAAQLQLAPCILLVHEGQLHAAECTLAQLAQAQFAPCTLEHDAHVHDAE